VKKEYSVYLFISQIFKIHFNISLSSPSLINCLFSSLQIFEQRFLRFTHPSPRRAACPTCLILLSFIILIIFTGKLKLLSSYLCSLLLPFIILSLLYRNTVPPCCFKAPSVHTVASTYTPVFPRKQKVILKWLLQYLRLFVGRGKKLLNFPKTLRFKFSSNMQTKY